MNKFKEAHSPMSSLLLKLLHLSANLGRMPPASFPGQVFLLSVWQVASVFADEWNNLSNDDINMWGFSTVIYSRVCGISACLSSSLSSQISPRQLCGKTSKPPTRPKSSLPPLSPPPPTRTVSICILKFIFLQYYCILRLKVTIF